MTVAHQSAGGRAGRSHADLLTEHGPDRGLRRIETAGTAQPRYARHRQRPAQHVGDRLWVGVEVEHAPQPAHSRCEVADIIDAQDDPAVFRLRGDGSMASASRQPQVAGERHAVPGLSARDGPLAQETQEGISGERAAGGQPQTDGAWLGMASTTWCSTPFSSSAMRTMLK